MPDDQHSQLTERKDLLIPLRDGVHLAANLLLPDGAGPVPAIVVYFPYLKDGPHGRGAIYDWQAHFARRGYACLTVDFRGTGASEGRVAPPFSASEREDALDLHDWIVRQPWCSGTTGQWGISYSGSSALAAASMRPASLKAIVSMHGTANEFSGFLHPHGCRPGWWTEASWGPMMVLLSLLPPLSRDPERRWARVWQERLATLEPWPYVWHSTPFDAYMAWRTDPGRVQAATYAVSAWHDYYPQATFDYFNAIPAPKRILIGPWRHELPDLARNWPIDHLADMDRWWDRWLKGQPNGIEAEPPILVWQQGKDAWRFESEWPPRRGEPRVLYAAPDGRLVAAPPTGEGSDRYRVDPSVGLHLLPWDPQGPTLAAAYDRSEDDHRARSYTTEPLSEPLELCGQPEATVAFTSDEPEFPLSVWLCDVAPDGRSSLICQGWTSAAYAAGGALARGRVYELAVPLYSTCYRVAAGHRLRFGIAGSHFPLLWPGRRNPTLDVRRSAAHATRVRLPLTPSATSPQAGPRFGTPTATASPRHLHGRAEHRVERELDGSLVAFRQRQESTTRLDDGSLLHLRELNRSALPTERPEDTVLSGQFEAVLERAVDGVRVSLDAVQTFDRSHFEGRIELDGRPIFERAWDLDLPYCERLW